MNNTAILILILLLIVPFVQAEQIDTSTNVTIDFVGNDLYYLRTETADFGPFNVSAQTDRSFQVNLTRHTDTNQTDTEQILAMMQNMTKSCVNISTQLILADAGYQELSRNWSRCNLDKEALMVQVPQYASAVNNWSSTYNITVSTLANDKQFLTGALRDCQIQASNYSQLYTAEQGANSNKTVLVVIVVGVAAYLVWQEIQRKKKAHPDEMSLLSQQ